MDKLDEFSGRADIYAAMAAANDETEDQDGLDKPLIGGGINNRNARSVPVTVGDKTVEVPTMAYVSSLENTIREQKLELQKQARLLRALGQILRQQKATTGHHADHLNSVRRELDYKIDRRD